MHCSADADGMVGAREEKATVTLISAGTNHNFNLAWPGMVLRQAMYHAEDILFV